MIKKFLLLALVAFFCQMALTPVLAVKASPFPIKITQPDGTQLTIRLHGSEFNHYQTTEDGYVLKADSKGFLTYATVNTAGVLVASNVIAKNVNSRTTTESQFLKSINQITVQQSVQSTVQKSKMLLTGADKPRRAYPLNGSPKALVILVNFSDQSFSVPNPQTSFQNLVTQSGYSANGGTGSAKDYFMASTYGKFAPDFVVVGPVTLPKPLNYYGQNDVSGQDSLPANMIVDACKAADAAGLDFTQFDTDGDGYVDNVFVYYAGYNEAEGAAANTIWPHRWSISSAGITTGITFDGKKIEDYSCTSELKGTSGTNMCGVGTFCHEFGHVLGLPDYYDTSGSSSYIATLETWEIMDYGPYLNGGCTPPTYSVWDRFFLGYLTPQQISTAADITLNPLYQGTTPPANTDNQCYLIASTTHNLNGAAPNPAEFFLVEYRKHTGWDTYLGQNIDSKGNLTTIPGDGMCVWHIDYLQSAWDNNSPNNYTGATQTKNSHMRVYLQPLSGQTTTPGTTFSTGSFTPTTWSGTNLNKPITSIAMTSSNVTFKFMGGAVVPTVTALAATNVTPTGFTANWTAVTGATGYLLNVYKKSTSTGTTPKTVLSENFDKFSTGTYSTPGNEVTTTLDTYTQTTGWTGSKVYPANGTVKIGTSSVLGYLTTPSIDLSANNGSFNVSLKSMAWSADSTKIKIYLNNVLVKTLSGLTNDANYTLNPFSVNLTGGTSTSKIKFEGNQAAKGRFYIDDVVITSGVGTTTTITKILTDLDVSNSTSYNVTGLSPDVYYYTVKAVYSSNTSQESNEIMVSLTTGIDQPNISKGSISTFKGGINVSGLDRGQVIRVFDITGKLVKELNSDGNSTIYLKSNSMYIVRYGSNNVKIVVE